MNKGLRYIISIAFMLLSVSGFGDGLYKGSLGSINQFNILIDSTNSLVISDIMGIEDSRFSLSSKLKLPSNISVWVKIRVDQVSNPDFEYLVIEQTQLDYFEWYGVVGNEIVISDTGGIEFPFFTRKLPFNKWVLEANQANTENITFYLKIRTSKSVFLDMKTGKYIDIIKEQISISSLFGIFVGIFVVMAFYNSFIYVSTKERSYFIYVLHTIFVGLTQVTIFGYGYNFFWPNSPGFQQIGVELLSSIVSLVGLEFLKEFLQTKKNAPKLHKVVNVLIVGYLVIAILSIVQNDLAYQVLLVTQPLVAVFVIFTAFNIFLDGYRPAKYYLIAWGALMVGLTIYALGEQGIIVRNTVATMMMPFGSALEVILLSFALADNINSLKSSQERAIANSLRLEKEKASLIIEQNVELEEQVEKRTHELQGANYDLAGKNKELNDAYIDLKNTQSQLVHAEKMSSLGQLTAGIAHEINNPINFVSSNILPLKRDVQDLISIFEETKNYAKEKLSEEDYVFIDNLKEQYDYTYILEEIDQLLAGMDDGANRTVEIIRGLKLFSRVDEDDLKRVNLEDGINSTLILLNSAIKHQLTLIKNFGDIPEVECYGGKMNQVFMNIISNSIQALKGREPEENEITITTTHKTDFVTIAIKDNGPGMTEEVKNKLFEPFFTTKPVGEGTGLGLSIVYKIIDKIDGKITVNSEPGKGTEFIITLPINNKSKD